MAMAVVVEEEEVIHKSKFLIEEKENNTYCMNQLTCGLV